MATVLIEKFENLEPGKVRVFMISPEYYQQAFQELVSEKNISKNMGRITVSLNKTHDAFYDAYCSNCKRTDCIFVDCASVLTGDSKVEGKSNVIALSNIILSEISIAITEAVNRLEVKNIFLVFDSIQSLLIYFSEEDIFRFLHSLILKLKQFGVTAFLLSVNQEMGREMTKVLGTVADEFLQFP